PVRLQWATGPAGRPSVDPFAAPPPDLLRHPVRLDGRTGRGPGARRRALGAPDRPAGGTRPPPRGRGGGGGRPGPARRPARGAGFVGRPGGRGAGGGGRRADSPPPLSHGPGGGRRPAAWVAGTMNRGV